MMKTWPSNREPYHGDIVQGRLGNCFLIASLQALASCQSQLLKSIVSSSSTCFFYRRGEQIEVPVILEPITEEYQYCRSTVDDVQWPYMIEQAYAKFYGGRFENLIGGNTSEALYDLVGKPVEEFEINDKSDVWERIQQGLTERTVLVTCGAVNTNTVEPTCTANGLFVNHAYSILSTFFDRQSREKYVLIHNPQGINHLLKENTRVREAFFALHSKNHPLWANTTGTQLVSWSELKKSCNRIQICYLNVESRQILFNNWSTITSGGCTNFATFYRNPFILLSPSHLKKTIFILGHTIDQRQERTVTDVKLNYEQIGITIVELKSHSISTHDNYEIVCQSKFWNKREVALPLDILPKQGQKYAIVLSSYYPNVNTTFWLQIFSKQILPNVEICHWTSLFHQPVQTIRGEWHRGNAGGKRTKPVQLKFYENPAYLLTLSNNSSVRLILHQLFDTEIPLAQYHPTGIYVLSTTFDAEIDFIRARSVSRLVQLKADEEYYVIPTCFQANSLGKFELNVLCDVPFVLDPIERKFPIPPPPPPKPENKPNSTIKAKRAPPKKGNLSFAAARASNLADEYTTLDVTDTD